MKQQNKDSKQISKNAPSPQIDDTVKQQQREKAEVQEVAGRHTSPQEWCRS